MLYNENVISPTNKDVPPNIKLEMHYRLLFLQTVMMMINYTLRE